jgi:hypothetical protein
LLCRRQDAPALEEGRDSTVDEDLKRQIIKGLLSLVLSIIAARLAVYITNKILGEPDDLTKLPG